MSIVKTQIGNRLLDGVSEPPMDNDEAAELAELFQALGDPTRLRILSVLDTACIPVGAIAEATGLRQPAVSHHLRVLRDRGLVRPERRGAYIYYCASTEALRPAIDAARVLLGDRGPR
ncbi:helix-turn-helix transcriptional regulator [Ferrimicrobium sp.]|uniref:ArsR/SmtB family transcription factor n=1 Tax=Ferrimicrobium sp. TaxID=2926050 RepID=UPI00261071A6|nr:metalloregulator ArsR/SmtB family transcription factor [Ferrimicrobium sp.]